MPSEAIALVVVAGSGGTGAAVDLLTRRVPNPLTLGTSALGFALAAADLSGVTVGQAAVGLGLGAALMMPGHVFGQTGAGDVKLFAALGTLLGPSRIGMAFLYTAIAGGVLALVIAAMRGNLTRSVQQTAQLVRTKGRNVTDIEHASDNRIPYAPAVACGALAAALGF